MSKIILVFFIVLSSLGMAAASVAQMDQPMAEASETVNINTANVGTLAARLAGVGTARASAIVAYREEHGGFESVEELTAVSGIGPAILENNRHLLAIE